LRIHNVDLDAGELLRLKVMDAYEMMRRDGKVNVRYLCRLMSIGKSTFYKWKKRYKRYNLTTIKTRSRRPKSTRTIPWQVVVEILPVEEGSSCQEPLLSVSAVAKGR